MRSSTTKVRALRNGWTASGEIETHASNCVINSVASALDKHPWDTRGGAWQLRPCNEDQHCK